VEIKTELRLWRHLKGVEKDLHTFCAFRIPGPDYSKPICINRQLKSINDIVKNAQKEDLPLFHYYPLAARLAEVSTRDHVMTIIDRCRKARNSVCHQDLPLETSVFDCQTSFANLQHLLLKELAEDKDFVALGNDSERGDLRLPENKVLFNKQITKQRYKLFKEEIGMREGRIYRRKRTKT